MQGNLLLYLVTFYIFTASVNSYIFNLTSPSLVICKKNNYVDKKNTKFRKLLLYIIFYQNKKQLYKKSYCQNKKIAYSRQNL